MKKFCAVFLLTGGIAFASADRLEAAPIGTFAWDSCGPELPQCYRVENFSDLFFPDGFTFTDITLTFATPGDPIPDASMAPLSTGGGNTISDLPFGDISLASLSFTVGAPGVITLLDSETFQPILGLTSVGQSATIDFTPGPVPEPGTLLLLMTGIATLAGRRRIRRLG